ncbi:MAG: hypothetical protein AAF226_09905, partial [Verrucomicrobiota bacterium]
PDNTRLEEVDLQTPSDQTLTDLEITDGEVTTGATSRPGIYRWRVKGQTVALTPINFPPSESNLASLTIEQTRSSADVAVSGGDSVRHLRDGLKLWPWLLGAAAVFLIFESLVMVWAGRTT